MFSNSQIQNNPVYSLPHLYVSGMNISAASNTVIAIAPGQARDMNNVIDMPVSFQNLQGNIVPPVLDFGYQQPLFINSAVNGANGLDQGSIAASSNYFVWLIGDSRGYKPVAGLLSLYSNAFPLLPLGYDSLLRLGFVSTGGGSTFTANTILNYQYARNFYLQPAISELSGGNATTFTGIDLDSSIALGTQKGVIALFSAIFIPAAVGDIAQLRPTGSGTGTSNLVTITGLEAGIPQQQYVAVACGVNGSSHTSIDYLVSSASDALSLSTVGYSYTTV